MKTGKISESVLKRSVLKQIRTKRPEVLSGASVGLDCAAIELLEDEVFVVSTDPITGTTKDAGKLAVHVAANDVAASGAQPVAVLISALLPEETEEVTLRETMQQVEEACEELHIQAAGGHTEVSAAVNQMILTVTGIGKVKKGQLVLASGARAGQDILVTKWIGLEGTAILAKEKEKELLERFAPGFVEDAKSFDRFLSVVPEAATAVKSGVSAMHDITEGGIFGALWEMAEASGVGLEIDLKKIPVKQETIEICNYYDISPYGLMSSGSMLMAVDNGHDLVRELEKQGIHAVVIGKAMPGNDRVVINEDERRFLEPAKTDELYKL